METQIFTNQEQTLFSKMEKGGCSVLGQRMRLIVTMMLLLGLTQVQARNVSGVWNWQPADENDDIIITATTVTGTGTGIDNKLFKCRSLSVSVSDGQNFKLTLADGVTVDVANDVTVGSMWGGGIDMSGSSATLNVGGNCTTGTSHTGGTSVVFIDLPYGGLSVGGDLTIGGAWLGTIWVHTLELTGCGQAINILSTSPDITVNTLRQSATVTCPTLKHSISTGKTISFSVYDQNCNPICLAPNDGSAFTSRFAGSWESRINVPGASTCEDVPLIQITDCSPETFEGFIDALPTNSGSFKVDGSMLTDATHIAIKPNVTGAEDYFALYDGASNELAWNNNAKGWLLPLNEEAITATITVKLKSGITASLAGNKTMTLTDASFIPLDSNSDEAGIDPAITVCPLLSFTANIRNLSFNCTGATLDMTTFTDEASAWQSFIVNCDNLAIAAKIRVNTDYFELATSQSESAIVEIPYTLSAGANTLYIRIKSGTNETASAVSADMLAISGNDLTDSKLIYGCAFTAFVTERPSSIITVTDCSPETFDGFIGALPTNSGSFKVDGSTLTNATHIAIKPNIAGAEDYFALYDGASNELAWNNNAAGWLLPLLNEAVTTTITVKLKSGINAAGNKIMTLTDVSFVPLGSDGNKTDIDPAVTLCLTQLLFTANVRNLSFICNEAALGTMTTTTDKASAWQSFIVNCDNLATAATIGVNTDYFELATSQSESAIVSIPYTLFAGANTLYIRIKSGAEETTSAVPANLRTTSGSKTVTGCEFTAEVTKNTSIDAKNSNKKVFVGSIADNVLVQTEGEQIKSVTIYDMAGRMIYSAGNVNATYFKYRLPAISNYIVKVVTDKEVVTEKIFLK